MEPLHLAPPLLNSANPWATTIDQLRDLYECPHTGAVTIRTSLLTGFEHNDKIHQHVLFSLDDDGRHEAKATNSLNTLGYSPTALSEYCSMIELIVSECEQTVQAQQRLLHHRKKPFIVSVTGSPADVVQCHDLVSSTARKLRHPCWMEINLSCPNIAGKPPPAYDSAALADYLHALLESNGIANAERDWTTGLFVPVGIKTPPYTYSGQFGMLVETLSDAIAASKLKYGRCINAVHFITATNTLGSSLVLTQPIPESNWTPALQSATGFGVGGLAGAALHPLALGNVATLRQMLGDADHGIPKEAAQLLAEIKIIGTGGVSNSSGYERMRAAGATWVGVGTALGVEGIAIFGQILQTLVE